MLVVIVMPSLRGSLHVGPAVGICIPVAEYNVLGPGFTCMEMAEWPQVLELRWGLNAACGEGSWPAPCPQWLSVNVRPQDLGSARVPGETMMGTSACPWPWTSRVAVPAT